MAKVKKLAIINVVILLIYTIINFRESSIYSHTHEIAISTALYTVVAILAHILINLVLSANIFSKDSEKKKWGKAYLINCLIILISGVIATFISLSF